jgi:DNA-binding MarR family transcriptional regulator
MPTTPASEQDQQEISKALKSDDTAIMVAIRDEPGISLADIARRMGWHNKQMLPDRSKAQRRIRVLEKKKLVERDDDVLELTDKGKSWLAKQQGKKKEATPKGGPDLTLVKS